MTDPAWESIKQIVAEAVGLDPEARAELLDRECAGNPNLRREVETLLKCDGPGLPFSLLDSTPERLGPYRIIREVGRGGMGTVYLAERDDGQFQQRVAIKVIKRGMDTEAVLRRFWAERQILARLQHPNITRLLDGGTFDGRPYFVMEYLEGEPLVEYCRRRELGVEAGIALFLAVSDAVENAHRNLILHRDIKSGNILVDASGTPKLMDFGIAKLLGEGEGADQTAVAVRPMTPQSASPEQVRGEPLTTASDVYALGLLLFELLSDAPPYRVMSAASPEDLARIVCEEPVPKPSSAAKPDRAKALRGDLDNIVLKALEKDPARRYQGAAEMAQDLRRYLSGLPVLAKPGSAFYRARKFARRNRRALVAASLMVLAVGGALADAIREQRRAQHRFDQLRQLAGSFLFEIHDAVAPLPGSTPVRELVVKRALQYLDSLAGEASGDIDLKRELAESYARVGDAQGLYTESNLGKTAEARASYQKAMALFQDVVRARPSDRKAIEDLADVQLRLSATTYTSDPQGGMILNRKTAAMLEQFNRRQPLSEHGEIGLARAYFGIAESEQVLRHPSESLAARVRSIDLLRRVIVRNPENWEAQRSLTRAEARMASLYQTQFHDVRNAAAHLAAGMEVGEKVLSHEPSPTAKLDLALLQSYLAANLRSQGRLPEACEMTEHAIATRAEVLRADPRNLRARVQLMGDYMVQGAMLRELKRPADAQSALQKGLRLGDEMDAASAHHPDVVSKLAALRQLAAAGAK